MPIKYDWEITFVESATTRYLGNIQNLNFKVGRNNAFDPYSGGGGSIVIQNPTSLTYFPILGDDIQIILNYLSTPYGIIYGRVTDISISYGLTQTADMATITFEDFVGRAGRSQRVNESISSAVTTDQFLQVLPSGFVDGASTSVCSAQTFTGSVLDYVNKLVLTENGRFGAIFNVFVGWLYVFWQRQQIGLQQGGGFTDGTLGATQSRYDNLIFETSANTSIDQAVVSPTGLVSQSAGTGSRSLQVNTLDATTAQASDNANYILNRFTSTSNSPVAISCTDQQQSNAILHEIIEDGYWLGQQQTITFRGELYNVVVEGFSVSVTPDQSRFTFYVSPQDQNAYLILDNDVYGVIGGTGIIYNTPMDYNEAGYIYNDNYADNGNRLGF